MEDQTQKAKVKSKAMKYELTLHQDNDFPPKKSSYIAVNGKNIHLQHGVTHIVDEWVVNALNECVKDEPVQKEEEGGIKTIMTETTKQLRYSFTAMPYHGPSTE